MTGLLLESLGQQSRGDLIDDRVDGGKSNECRDRKEKMPEDAQMNEGKPGTIREFS